MSVTGAANESVVLSFLVTNLLQGIAALWWVAGLGRVLRPLPPVTWARLLALALILPPLILLAHALGAPMLPAELEILRVDLWAQALLSSTTVVIVGGLIMAGTVWIFLLQELVPVLQARGVQRHAERTRDHALEASVEAVIRRYEAAGVRLPAGRRLRALSLETDTPLAALEGVVEPVLVVSRGLRAALDHHELEAVLAHEVAHWVQGGNRRFLLVWLMRALQAASPPALVLFRLLVEAREAAADAQAAEVTGKPAVLAAALLKLQRGSRGRPDAGVIARARARVLRRAEVAATTLRVRTLLDGRSECRAPLSVSAVAVTLFVLLLWGVA